MSLLALEMENFKGIGERQRAEFAPLTLLFGANGAGKSTILQALVYLHELVERGQAEVDRTELGGKGMVFGGFRRLVHRHETERTLRLRVEFETPGRLERFGRDLEDFPFPDLDDGLEAAWLEVAIRWGLGGTSRGATLEEATIGVVGEKQPLVSLALSGFLREGEPLWAKVNFGHPLLAAEGPDTRRLWKAIALEGTPLSVASDSAQEESLRPLVFAMARTWDSALPPVYESLRVLLPEDAEGQEALAEQVRVFFEMVVLGTIGQLLPLLKEALYIGPLRKVPQRGFLYERSGRSAGWADGLAAWEELLSDRALLVERTNEWLERVGAGCKVVIQQLFEGGASAEELSREDTDKTVRRLLLDVGSGVRVQPSEIGVGIAQLLPVVVGALLAPSRLTLIEQPEIHVHPAIQVGLGDLFIAATKKNKRRPFLVETHSEHLILRLLRRIRETTEEKRPEGLPPFTAEEMSVLYVERREQGVFIQRLRVDSFGEFQDRWPQGFFDERFEEVYGS